METKVSSKGQVVLPSPLRQRLGLRPGDALDVSLEVMQSFCVRDEQGVENQRLSSTLALGLPC